MAHKIYLVFAMVVDANGTWNQLSGYPKKFDSDQYNNDEEKARRRAEGDMSEVWGAMCKRDDRQVQTVWMTDEQGTQLDCKSWGSLPEPEVTETPENPENPEVPEE